jgi:hypothetical protein
MRRKTKRGDQASEGVKAGQGQAEAVSEPDQPDEAPHKKAEWVDIAEEEQSKIAAEEEARRAVERERDRAWVQK